jgi:ubiquinone/menaquinone biosynthesis C-methylase UbiE
MDEDGVDVVELRRALAFIRRVNRWLGYNRAVVGAVVDACATVPRDRPVRILDVATGSGDLLVDLKSRFDRMGRAVELTGLDRHEATLDFARERSGGVASIVAGDATSLPFADASFDVVTSALFLHHLDEPTVVRVLAEMKRVTRHAVVNADLIRRRRAYAWISLFTTFASPMVRHDARASVAHAFTIDEAGLLIDRAGMSGTSMRETFGHRFIATWHRG